MELFALQPALTEEIGPLFAMENTHMSYRLAITDRTECPGEAGDWPARFLVTKTVPGQPAENTSSTHFRPTLPP